MNKPRLKWGAFLAFLLVLLISIKACQHSPLKELSMLELLELYQSELKTPGTTPTQAAKQLGNAKAAYRFVRDEIVLTPYRGRVQMPAEVLQSRMANTVDKAALLGVLLSELGWSVEYQFSDDVPELPTQKIEKSSPPSEVLEEIAQRIDYDLDELDTYWEQALKRYKGHLAGFNKVLDDANKLLSSRSAYYPKYSRIENPSPQGKWIIVLAKKDDKTRQFDPVYYDQELPKYLAEFVMPEPFHPVVEIRIVDDNGLEQTLIRYSDSIVGHDVKLHFLPAIDTLSRLQGSKDPSDIKMWQPFLIVDGKGHMGKPFSLEGKTPSLRDTPPIKDLTKFVIADASSATAVDIANVDVSQWPYVRLSLKVVSSDKGVWLPAHFQITDNGQNVNGKLLNLQQTSKPILILTDVSTSMEDIHAFETSKQAITQLVKQLPPETSVGLTSFAMEPVRQVPVSPLGDGVAYTQAVNALTTGSSTGIIKSLEDASNIEGLGGGYIVLLSDGYDNVGGDLQPVIDALNKQNIRVFVIALGKDSDATLLSDIAKKTDGYFQKIASANELEAFYHRLGSELTNYVVLEYDASNILASTNNEINTTASVESSSDNTTESLRLYEDSVPVTSAEKAYQHKLEVKIKSTSLLAESAYDPPPETIEGQPAQITLHMEIPYLGSYREVERVLVNLSDPDVAWKLTGDYSLIGDIGGHTNKAIVSAYIAKWQQAWTMKANPDVFEPKLSKSSTYEQMLLLNGFRALSTVKRDEELITLGVGPNYYLRRSWVTTRQNTPMLRQVFDVLYRDHRSRFSHKSDKVVDMEIASIRAEGAILEGDNGIDALLAVADKVETFNLQSSKKPEWMSTSLWQEALKRSKEMKIAFASSLKPHWLWQLETDHNHYFRVLYGDGNIVAKGASDIEIAQLFDRIDKMYGLYDAVAGNYLNLISRTGAQLSAISSFKREENKLWCYSTIMMGYVGDAIEDNNALLKRDVGSAKSRAAKLCKINGNPDDVIGFFRNAVKNAAKDGIYSFITNVSKEDAYGWKNYARSHSALTLGGAILDYAISYSATATTLSDTPVTPAFHNAMGKAWKSDK